MAFIIREQKPGDEASIQEVTDAAFKDAPCSSGTEGAIVEELRNGAALHLSLVAISNSLVRGHVAFSRITIDGRDVNWYGLGPVSVHPDSQAQGIGKSLVEEGLRRLRDQGASGCVVLGDPAYYKRFGFVNNELLRLEGVPADHFMALPLQGSIVPPGTVAYHSAFS